MTRLKVSIVDDDAEIRNGLTFLIKNAPNCQFLTAYCNAEEALKGLPQDKPDVVLMDINMGAINGIECIRRLKTMGLSAQFVMLTVYEDSDLIFQSLVAGASGYLLKRARREELLQAIEDVHQGGAPMSSHIARKVVQHFQAGGQPDKPDMNKLSSRELEVLECLSKGCQYKEISDSLHISLDTVRNHVRSIYSKLHVHTRTEAVVKYLQR